MTGGAKQLYQTKQEPDIDSVEIIKKLSNIASQTPKESQKNKA